MNLISVNITSFREKLSDYLVLVGLGKAIISVRNAKSGKEVARIVSPVSKESEVDTRIKELEKMVGFAADYPEADRIEFKKMDRDYVEKLRQRIIE